MSKAADAFRTISEVADELDVPKHVLRFWEARFPQIKPMKRGGGRRYYRPTDLDLLRGVRHLLHSEGFTIKGVQKILREQGVEEVKSCWQPGNQLVAPTARTTTAAQIATAQAAGAKGKRRGKSTKGAAAPIDVKATLAKLMSELKACRSILKGEEEPARQRSRG